jgi:hypothetical protein
VVKNGESQTAFTNSTWAKNCGSEWVGPEKHSQQLFQLTIAAVKYLG